MSEPVRYGVIGTGMMGREHIANVRALPGAEVTAIADPDPGSLDLGRQLADLPEEACFEDYSDLLAIDLDAVVIATPNHTHGQVVFDALQSDAHLLVEKPLATTVEECDRIIEAARGRRAMVWMGLEYRYKPAIARLVSEVRKGRVGKVHMVSITEHRYPFLAKVGNWNRFNQNTGGTLVEKCCHFFDLMNLLTESPPVRVYGSGSQSVNHLGEIYEDRVPDVIDNAYVVVDYEGGERALLDLCMFAEGSKNEQELSVVGDTGKVESFVPESVVRIGERATREVVEVSISDDRIAYMGAHEGSSFLEHLDFVEAIREGSEPKVTLEEGRIAVAMGVAGHRSIEEGRPVAIEEVLGA